MEILFIPLKSKNQIITGTNMVAIPLNTIEVEDIVELILPVRTPNVLYTVGHTFKVIEIVYNSYYTTIPGSNDLYVLEDLHNPNLVTTVGLGMIVKKADLALFALQVSQPNMLN